MATENILEAVDRIESAVCRFERILYGDPPARPNGLLVEFERLRRDVQGLREDVQRLKARRPNMVMWSVGYLSYLAAGTLGIAGLMNQFGEHDVFGLPGSVALGLAVLFAILAAFLLIGGHGWLDGGS